jgi:hypothetical protein
MRSAFSQHTVRVATTSPGARAARIRVCSAKLTVSVLHSSFHSNFYRVMGNIRFRSWRGTPRSGRWRGDFPFQQSWCLWPRCDSPPLSLSVSLRLPFIIPGLTAATWSCCHCVRFALGKGSISTRVGAIHFSRLPRFFPWIPLRRHTSQSASRTTARSATTACPSTRQTRLLSRGLE